MSRVPISIALVAKAGGEEVVRTPFVPYCELEVDLAVMGGETICLERLKTVENWYGRSFSYDAFVKLPLEEGPVEIELPVDIPPQRLAQLDDGRVIRFWDLV